MVGAAFLGTTLYALAEEGAGKGLSFKQCCDGEVLVELWPVDADTVANQPPPLALSLGSLAQCREPFKGHADLAAIRQQHMQHVLIKLDVFGYRLHRFNDRNAHPIAP